MLVWRHISYGKKRNMKKNAPQKVELQIFIYNGVKKIKYS